MQKQTKLEEILRAFDETLRPLYLECEAGFAEDLQCEIARKAVFLLETERKEAVEGFVEGYKRHLKDRAGFKGKVCALLTHGKDSQAYWDLKVFERKFEQYLTQTKGETK